MQKITRLLSAFMIGVFVFGLTVSTVFAIGIKPLRTELTIDPGASVTAKVRVINSESVPIKAKVDMEIYTKNDELGFPVVETISDDHPMNIRSWVTFNDPMIEIAPNSEKEVSFTVTVPSDAEPGGRYASIVYEPVVNSAEAGLKVNARVASLILIDVTGAKRFDNSVTGFGPKDDAFYGDQHPTFVVRFVNNGNTHVKPNGSIALIDESGQQLLQIAKYQDPKTGAFVTADTIPVNIVGGNVLPGSARNFEGVWNENVQTGKFTAKLRIEPIGDQPAIEKTLPIDLSENVTIGDFQIKEGPNGVTFEIAATNTGTVNERLKGKVDVQNQFQSIVASPEIPAGVDYIAPGATTTVSVPWLVGKTLRDIPAGNYSAKLVATYGFKNAPLSAELTFKGKGEGAPNNNVFYAIGILLVLLIAVLILKNRKKQQQPPQQPQQQQ